MRNLKSWGGGEADGGGERKGRGGGRGGEGGMVELTGREEEDEEEGGEMRGVRRDEEGAGERGRGKEWEKCV
eukprot:751083-Hanusia_phi.AAC.5